MHLTDLNLNLNSMQIKNRQNEIISDMFAEYQICMEISRKMGILLSKFVKHLATYTFERDKKKQIQSFQLVFRSIYDSTFL